MHLNIYKDYSTLSLDAAEVILDTIKNNPAAVLCLATGDSPRLTYQLMVKKVLEEKVDLSHCTFIGLDEWVGIPPHVEGSCHFFLETLILKPLHITASQVHLFNALAEDTKEECRKMDKIIVEKNGIDLMVAGVGMNGHIGFNEPGISPDKCAHIINLDAITQSVGQKYFTQTTALKQGITLGLKQVSQSKKLIMMANGIKKAEVIRKALEGAITNQLPAGIIRTHSNGWVMIDEAAASMLDLKAISDNLPDAK